MASVQRFPAVPASWGGVVTTLHHQNPSFGVEIVQNPPWLHAVHRKSSGNFQFGGSAATPDGIAGRHLRG